VPFLTRVLLLVVVVWTPFLLTVAVHRRQQGAGMMLVLPFFFAPPLALAALLVYAPLERHLSARGLGHLVNVGVPLAGAAAGVAFTLVMGGRPAILRRRAPGAARGVGRGLSTRRWLGAAWRFGAVGAAGGLLWRLTDVATRGLAADGGWALPSVAVPRVPAALGDVPASCKFLVAAAVLLLLRALPVTRVMLGPLAWSVLPGVLLNLGFAGVAYEVLARGAPRGWLALPALWFGGYALWLGCDWWALARLRREIAVTNAGVRIPFDQDAHALLVTEDHHTTDRAEGTAAWLVERYDVGVAYARYGAAPTTHAWRLAPPALAQEVTTLKAQGRYVAARPFAVTRPSGERAAGAPASGPLLLRVPDAPDRPVVHVWHVEREVRRGTLPVRLVTTTVRTTDGRSYELRSGEARPLLRSPLPLLGFTLDSGTPALWRITRWPRRRIALVGGGTHAALARALGLTPARPDA
jgi:hypothetical protein